jgi:hypothetical protein
MKSLLFLITLLSTLSTFAQDIFTISKSMNPNNVLHYKAKIENCKLKTPAITPYWIMGEQGGHVEGLTSKEVAYFQPKISYANDREADFSIGAMESMGNKIPNKSIRVRLESCKPKAFIDIKGNEIQILGIYVNVNMFMTVNYMTISGLSSNGQKVTHRIDN